MTLKEQVEQIIKLQRMASERSIVEPLIPTYKAAILYVCNKLQVPFLASQITFELNDRTLSRAGAAFIHTNKIELSVPLFFRSSEKERYTTIIHEVCHLIAWTKYRDKGHGVHWAHCMLTAGLNPDRCHNIDVSDLKQIKPRVMVEVTCNCGKTYKVTKNRRTRLLKVNCNRCRTPFRNA